MYYAKPSRGPIIVLRLFSLALFLISGVLLFFQVQRYQRSLGIYAQEQTIARVPVGGLTRTEAGERVSSAYALPVELDYDGAIIDLYPLEAGFSLDLDAMLDEADAGLAGISFWQGFADFVLNRPIPAQAVPLRSTIAQERLRTYLESQVAARYDRPPAPASPYPGTVQFMPGVKGAVLDVDAAIPPIEAALRSLTDRHVALPLRLADAPAPPFQNLDVLLRQTVLLSGFEGSIGVYLTDLQTAEEVHFLYDNGFELPVDPDAAFTGSSTIKIPVMVSVFRRLGENPDPVVVGHLERMIAQSDNESTDWLVNNVLEDFTGPLRVTDDMVTLGLKNTFLAGYFYLGAPLLWNYTTPANTRRDTNIGLDLYNQTTPSEMGMLLADIYQCAHNGGGALLAIFPGEITPGECQTMIDYLVEDRNPLLLQAGVPDGTRMAHKHGWISDGFGVIHNVSDAGIIFTPGGDYVMAVYLYHPVQLIFEPANRLVADLSRAAYSYFNVR